MNNPLFTQNTALVDSVLSSRRGLILDIGANTGGYTVMYAPHCEKVHAFEPVPDMYQRLVDVCRRIPNAYPFNLGVSDRVALVENVSVFNTWSLLPESDRNQSRALDYVGKAGFDLHLTTIDRHCEIHGDPGFIKLDVDGYERKVLLGAAKTLSRNPCPIYFEFSYLGKFFGELPEDLCGLVYDMGYQAVSLDGAFKCETASQMLDCYPHNTSFDIMLMPR